MLDGSGVRVGPAGPNDLAEWGRMRDALWPPEPGEDRAAELRAWLARPDAVVLVAHRVAGGLCGFAEVGERSTAEGCETQPVAYLEGWWVDADLRGRGIGRALVAAAEAWARRRGLRELASDTTLDNVGSQQAHERLGFVEVERAVHFRKAITPGASPPSRAMDAAEGGTRDAEPDAPA